MIGADQRAGRTWSRPVPLGVAIVIALLLACGGAGFAGSFIHPPEDYAPWDGSAPYQRNAKVDFADNPFADPVWSQPSGGPQGAWALSPALNCTFQGTDDLDLYESDWMQTQWSGGMADRGWHATDQWFGSNREGILWHASPWNTTLVVELTWNLNNRSDPKPYKNVWDELIFNHTGQIVAFSYHVEAHGQEWAFDSELNTVEMDGWKVQNRYTRIEPNPEWERIHMRFTLLNSATSGSGAYKPTRFSIASWRVATECVGENHWDIGYQDIGGGWRRLDWFGDYVPMGGEGWIWHHRHGFFFVPDNASPDSIWLYAEDMGWLWTARDIYPFLYRASDGAWLWYDGSVNPRWFFNWATGQWEPW